MIENDKIDHYEKERLIDYEKYWYDRIVKNKSTLMPRHYSIVELIYSKQKYGRVLDLGCGIPHILNMLPSSYQKYACDISETLSKVINKNEIEFSIADLNSEFPFKHEKFDFIVASEVLEHLHNPSNVLDNVKGCLVNDGLFIVTTPNPVNIRHRLRLLSGKMPTWDHTHVNFWTKNDFSKLLQDYGYRVLNIYPTCSHYLPKRVVIPFKFLYNLFGEQFLFSCNCTLLEREAEVMR